MSTPPLRPIAALAVAGAIATLCLLPSRTQAFNTLGSSLPMSTHRDVRVHDNFSDATANDNLGSDPSFPGHSGVELAIWKACVEWGSRLHGNGSGDVHQPGGLGSGGANFDVSWQGNAPLTGGFDNVHAELSGGDGGIYAYCESPIFGNGWRIRYYALPWVWEDGPGLLPAGRVDIQGIAAHEYGHALGLNHSGSGSATMFPSTSEPGSINMRSIASDDIDGVQFVYGVAAAGKPVITGIAQPTPGVLVIAGSNFDPTDNEVWFTQAVINQTGVPVKAFGVPSSAGGTSITVLIPSEAGSGDVLVRVPGTSGAQLSNAWPYDHSLSACEWQSFCTSSPNSVGPGAVLAGDGSTSMASNDFVLHLSGLPPGTIGIFYVGNQQSGGAPFGNGVNCVTGPVLRFGATFMDQLGGAAIPLDFGANPGNQMSADGTYWYFQFWYRNVAGGGLGFNTSNGLYVRWCP